MTLGTSLTGATLNAVAVPAPRLAGAAACALFRRPVQRGRVRSVERPVHEAAVVGRLRVDGVNVATYRWGEGASPVLLMHGWQSRASRFAAFIPRLQALGYTPVGFDAPGHGDSEGKTTTILQYRDIAAQLQEQHGPFDSVLANSFGVACAFLALRSGVQARRLVAVSGVCDFAYLLDGFCGALGAGDRVREGLRRRLETRLFAAEPGFWDRFSASYQPDEVAAEILAIHDEQDPVVPLAQSERIVAAYGDRARLVTTRGLGHRSVLTDPGVLETALDFLTAPAAACGAGGLAADRRG